MQHGGRTTGRARLALTLTFAMVATLLVSVAAPPAGTAEAVPAPTTPLPLCLTDLDGNKGLGCVPGQLGSVVSGTFSSGSTFVIDAGKVGPGVCADYVSTGCYYEVFSPSFVRCVYLYDNDPGDVRSCGSLSSSGSGTSSLAERQGTCRGELGSTYVLGGPANGDPSTWWVSRGPAAAKCEFQVPNTVDIDNLNGPTFFLVSASVDECLEAGRGYGCDESWAILERRTAYSWLSVEGDLAPRADFEPVGSPTQGLYSFVNKSVPFNQGTTTYEWDFGDGETAVGSSPSHQYTEAGLYRVRLTMRSSTGDTRTHSETVDLDSPDLAVVLSNPNAEFGPGKSGNRFDVGETFTALLVVKATEGVGGLTGVAPTAELLKLPDQLELVDDPILAEPLDMNSYDERRFEVKLKAKSAGRFTLRSSWSGKDETGRTKSDTGEFNGNVTGLKVEITPDRPSYSLDTDYNEDGNVTPEDNDVTFTVKVTNVSNAPITNIEKGPIDLTSRAEDNPAVRLFLQSSPVGDFPDLAPDQSAELEWVYRADDAVNADVSTLITGAQGSATITGLGEEVVQVFTSKLLEARIDVDGNQQFTSGKVITISGNFKNVSDTTDQERSLSFQVGRVLSGAFNSERGGVSNAGNAFFTTPGGATPEGMDSFRLEPGKEVDLDAIVQTLPSPAASGFNVRYRVYVNAIELDDEGNVVLKADGTPSWEEIDEMLVEIVEESGFSGEHDVTLTPVPQTPEETNFVNCAESLLLTFYTGCKLVRGVETMLRGLWGLAELAVDVSVAWVQANIWIMRTYFEFLTSDAAGRKALADEIVTDMKALYATGHRIVTNIKLEDLILAVPKFVDDTITRMDKVWQTGDMKLIMGEAAELAGENIDMVIEGLVAARTLAKVAKAAAGQPGPVLTNLERAWAKRRDQGLADLDNVIATKGHEAVPESRVLPAGLDVTDSPKVWRDSYGLHEDDLTNVLKISQDEGVTITMRSRAPESAALIKSGRALPKPQGIKTKGVNDIDIEYLGYKADWKAKVYVAEPPVPYFPEGPARDKAIRDWLDSNPKLADAPSDVRDAVTARLHTRLDEWPEMLDKMKDWKKEGVFVDFDPGFNGFPDGILHQKPNLDARLTRDDIDGRKAWRIEMKAPADAPPHPDGEVFRDITGDIDFLAILKPDGTVLGANGDLAELAKRGRVYEKMRALLGMQHGESFTIVKAKPRTKYVKDGVDGPGGETLLAATPNGRLLTTYFDDTLSTLKGGPNTQLGELTQGRAFFAGAFSELRSPARSFDAITLEQLFRLHRSFKQRVLLPFTVSALARLIAALTPGDVSPELSRDGRVLAPDENGDLVEFTSGPGGPAGNSPAVDKPASDTSADASPGLVAQSEQVDDDAAIDAEIAEVVAAGYDPTPEPGAAGGRWSPVDVGALVSDGPVALAPFTYLGEHTTSGSAELRVMSLAELSIPSTSAFFEVGDQVVVDPGGSAEEFATVASVSPFRLSGPLANEHELGTMIVLGGPGSTLNPLTPARLFESRVNEKTIDGVSQGGGRLAAGSVTTVQISGRGGVASGAAAVAVNVTAVRPAGVGYVTLFPCGEAQPLTSSLNYGTGGVAGNSGIVKLNAAGELCVFTFAETDLVLDVNAWLAQAPSFESLTPARLAETRSGEKTIDGEAQELGRLGAGSVTTVQVAGRGGVAAGADAVALNVTAVKPDGVGYVTLYPCDEDRPTTSSLNYSGGGAVGNSAVVSLSATGTLCVFTFADTDLVLDVNAWFADDASFDPFVPARFFETRTGEQTVDGAANGGGRLVAMSVTPIQVAGRGAVPGGASAVALNVTAVRPAGVGYITLFPCDGDQPLTSSLNYAAGGAVGNSGVVKLSAAGTVCAYTQADTDLVIDVNAAWTT